MKKYLFTTGILAGLIFLAACNKGTNLEYAVYSREDYAKISEKLTLPAVPHQYTLAMPKYLQSLGLFPEKLMILRRNLDVSFFTTKTFLMMARFLAQVATKLALHLQMIRHSVLVFLTVKLPEIR